MLVAVSDKPTLLSVNEERVKKLRDVLRILESRGGPSEPAVRTALYDGDAETIASTILCHTEKGMEGKQMIDAILALEPTGRLARFLAAELKKRANEIRAGGTA